MKFGGIAEAKIAEKTRAERCARKECLVHFYLIEAAHRPAIKPYRPRGKHEIRALQA